MTYVLVPWYNLLDTLSFSHRLHKRLWHYATWAYSCCYRLVCWRSIEASSARGPDGLFWDGDFSFQTTLDKELLIEAPSAEIPFEEVSSVITLGDGVPFNHIEIGCRAKSNRSGVGPGIAAKISSALWRAHEYRSQLPKSFVILYLPFRDAQQGRTLLNEAYPGPQSPNSLVAYMLRCIDIPQTF
jgi:hypothetical protein